MSSQPPGGPKRPNSQQKSRHDPASDLICLCNEVSRGTIEEAIRQGADTLNKIFDSTTAGVGPCGGSCRRKIQPMLDEYAKSGCFPTQALVPASGKGKNRRS